MNVINDKILVEVILEQKKTSIILSEADKARLIADNVKGKIISIGKGTSDYKMQTKIGDMILFNVHVGTKVEVKGKNYLVMREAEVIIVL